MKFKLALLAAAMLVVHTASAKTSNFGVYTQGRQGGEGGYRDD